MEEWFNRKYRKVLEILPDVIYCLSDKLILVGGTALALFYLKHRTSIDLDFVPIKENDTKLKEQIKGCLSKKGYRTRVGSYSNQFIVQFEDTSIKIEVFDAQDKIKFEEHTFAGTKILVATFESIFEMKQAAYKDRKEARDLFDLFCMLKTMEQKMDLIKKLTREVGPPKNLEDIDNMAINLADVEEFKKVIVSAT